MAGIVVARRGFLKCMSSIILPTFIPARVIQDIINGADPGRYVIPIERLMNARIGYRQDFDSIAAWMAAVEERWRELPTGVVCGTCITPHYDRAPVTFVEYGDRSWVIRSDARPEKYFGLGDTVRIQKFQRITDAKRTT